MFYPHLNLEDEDIMKKFGYIIAALATIAIAAPSIASAETTVIKRSGGHHERDGYREHGRGDKIVIKRGGYREGARAEYRGRDRDRGWHRGHDKKVVIIKHGRDRRD
jgi:hypothetical protein